MYWYVPYENVVIKLFIVLIGRYRKCSNKRPGSLINLSGPRGGGGGSLMGMRHLIERGVYFISITLLSNKNKTN